MKTKLTKIWGIGLTVMLLAMLIGAAIPVSAGSLGWSAVSAPSASNKILVEDEDIDFLVIAADGSTMFAYGNANLVLYKSTDGGVKWTTTGVGATLNGVTLVAMAISPDFANDKTIVAASTTAVYRSINSGASFGTVDTATLLATYAIDGADGVITSIAVTDQYYLGGQVAILIGTEDTGAGEYGGMLLFRTDTIAWSDMLVGGGTHGTGANGVKDVHAVAFSPNHQSDAQILAVATDTTNTILTTKFAGAAFNATVKDGTLGLITDINLISTTLTSGAVIAFAEDYEWSASNTVLVGTSSANATLDDVYEVKGRQAPSTASIVDDLDVGGSGTERNIATIAIKGPIATADVLAGRADSATVSRSSDVTASVVTWRSSTKSPGVATAATTPNTIVLWSPTGDTAYAGTGNSSGLEGNAVSRSTDGGVTWNGLGLISVSDITDSTTIDLIDSHVVDANTVFLVMADTGASAGAQESLFKTTNGGTSWERVLMSDNMFAVDASSDFANDQTVYVAQSDTRLWKSTNGGESFVGLTAPANVTALTVLDKDTYFTGHTALVYKSGRWNSGATKAGIAVNSIAVSPNFAADDTVIVGTADGDVYKSTNASATGGVRYSPVGGTQALGAGATVEVTFDPGFASNNILYAASSTNTVGVNRFDLDTSSIWVQLDDDTDTLAATGLVVTSGGTVYASSAAANSGVRREVGASIPTGFQVFESITTDLSTGAMLQNLQVVSGSNVIYAIASGIAFGSAEYDFRLLTYTDTMAVTPALVGPKDGAITPSTSVDLSWTAVESPRSVTYSINVATDSKFAVQIANSPFTVGSSGTGIKITGLTSGTKYYWRVRATAPLRSIRTGSWTFTPALGTTGTISTTTSPAPGESNVLLRPTFQWASVGGATSYEMELADNPFFASASVKKPLTHTVWTWDVDLEYSTTYYWRVRAVKGTNRSSWSEATFTTMDKAAPPAPPAAPPQIVVQPAPPAPPPVVNVPPAPPSPVTPAVIWAIIIIGAVLVIAVLVLIVRTRRVS